MISKISALLILVFSFAITACDNNRIYEKNIAITEGIWETDEIPEFEISIEDTVSLHNFYINLRNTGAYANSNIFIFIETEFPDKKMAKDTVECFLADARGKWLGKGSGGIWDNQILFKKGVVFPKPGIYKFNFQQGMRTPGLKEIIDIGLRIEKSN